MNLTARSGIAVLVEIGCYAIMDLGVSAGSCDGCEGDGGKLHFCCCVLGFCIEEEKEEERSTGFVHEKFSRVISMVCTSTCLVISSKSLVLLL